MRIIKDGYKPDMDISRVFKCHFCECIFEADKDEYKWRWTNQPEFKGAPIEFHLEAKCPCCGMRIDIAERKYLL